MPSGYVLAIDQGTTGSTVLVLNQAGEIVARSYSEFTQYYPSPGWVEHDADEIWEVTLRVARAALTQAKVGASDLAAIGITNQRETTVVWDRATGTPVTRAIVWQCRRTAPLCEKMKQDGLENTVRNRTGLVIDAYFSATKLAWILDNVPQARSRAEAGELLFGTIDTWLLWKLTGGRVHITDFSNASRTMLYNISDLAWDGDLTSYLGIPQTMLPRVAGSSQMYGLTEPELLGAEVPIAGIAGDQQAALFGQTCFAPGSAKNTYGTGCFLLMNTGSQIVRSDRGLLDHHRLGPGRAGHVRAGGVGVYRRRGGSVAAGRNAADRSRGRLRSSGDVDIGQRGRLHGPRLRGAGSAVLGHVRAGHYRGADSRDAAGRTWRGRCWNRSPTRHTTCWKPCRSAATRASSRCKADGGASANGFLMQFQADVLGVTVERPLQTESTAIGAAYLAGLAIGFWEDQAELKAIRKIDRCFAPAISGSERERLLAGWKHALACARTYRE